MRLPYYVKFHGAGVDGELFAVWDLGDTLVCVCTSKHNADIICRLLNQHS